MFNITDISAVQKQRPDLNDDQASEVLGFLNDAYAVESFNIINTGKLFKDTANYIFPQVSK